MQKEEKKLFKYVSAGAAFVAILIVVLKIFVFPNQAPAINFVVPLANIDINWAALRSQLEVSLPDFDVVLETIPENATASSPVSLRAIVTGTAEGIFKYNFDCQNDGKYELETDWVGQKSYTAENLCLFSEGSFTAKVSVSADLSYFNGPDQEIKEKRARASFAQVSAASANNAPVIYSCDVSSVAGTTQTDYPLSFVVQAQDPDGDNISFLWDFGDGQTATSSSPAHVFQSPGFYLPRVVVQDAKGAKSQCIVASLMVLNEFLPFSAGQFSLTQAGRQYPFRLTNQEPFVPGAVATSAIPVIVVPAATTTF